MTAALHIVTAGSLGTLTCNAAFKPAGEDRTAPAVPRRDAMCGFEQIRRRLADTIRYRNSNGGAKMQTIAYLALSAVLLVSALSVPVNRETGEGIIAFFSYGARMVEALGEFAMPRAEDGIEPIAVAAPGTSQR